MAAENLIGFVELRACIAELEDTRTTAERVLRALQSRQVQIRQLEENKQALLERYAGLLPDAVEALDSAERHRVYKMPRVEDAVSMDGSLEVSGDVMGVCEVETSST
jgi:hypothetical protein